MVEESRGGFVYKGLGKVPDRALLLFAALMYLFLYAPILVLVFFSFNSSRSTQVWTGFSTEWYGELLRDQTILDAFRTSIIVGVTATAIATVIGTLTALALTRYRFRGKTFADSAIYAATVMPEIVVGVSLLVFFVAAGIQLGIISIVIAHVAFTISFVTIVVRARLSGMDRSIEEAAQDLGANPIETFLRVTLPLILPGVMAGALLAFTLSLDDFVITFFVAASLQLGITTIIIAHVAFTISFVTIVVRARLSGMDQSIEEAAQDLGATPVQTFLRVTLPLILPGVMAGALLAFTLSFDDFVITFFVAGVGSSTLPLKIYSMIRFGVSPTINALSTVVLISTMVLILGGSRFLVRREDA